MHVKTTLSTKKRISITGRKVTRVLPAKPCPCIQAGGIGGGNTSQYTVETSCKKVGNQTSDKPPYCIPSMAEINAIPWNGFKVVSTFSGCGGSCLGYRMAGFKVVWANEFVPAAQDSYRANATADCYLDPRDIRLVQPEEILRVTGLKVGELDLYDGSPPCQAFSCAGKREKGWGKEKKYEHGASQCNETLFQQYVRILRGLMPKVFIAENVSGLVKGVAKGYFLEILKDLKDSGYNVQCRLCDAQWLGVPQARCRAIFIGVRNDLDVDPTYPKPLPYRYSVRDALPHISNLAYVRGQVAYESNWVPYNKQFDVDKEPCNTIPASTDACFKVGIVHPSGFSKGKTDSIDKPAPVVMAKGMTGFGHVQTLLRVQCGARPKTSKVATLPSPAIVAGRTTNMQTETHTRKFTIAEVKRICAFPDGFVLTGSYSQQWERLGNSVPPLMMKAIAEVVRDQILNVLEEEL